MKEFKIGDTLPNGAIVLAVGHNALPNRRTVLAVWAGRSTPFVTWRLGTDGDTYLGHYHDDISDAVADYEDRIRG